MKKIDCIAYTIHDKGSKCLVFVRGFDYHVFCSPTLKQITRLTLALEKQHGYLVPRRGGWTWYREHPYYSPNWEAGWNDPTETPPPVGKDILAILQDSIYDDTYTWIDIGAVTTLRKSPGDYFILDIGSDTWVKIVAWRPIPEIPEEFMKKD